MWHVASGMPVRTLDGHRGAHPASCRAPSARVSLCSVGAARLFTRACAGAVTSLHVQKDKTRRDRLYSSGADGTVRCWSLTSGRLVKVRAVTAPAAIPRRAPSHMPARPPRARADLHHRQRARGALHRPPGPHPRRLGCGAARGGARRCLPMADLCAPARPPAGPVLKLCEIDSDVQYALQGAAAQRWCGAHCTCVTHPRARVGPERLHHTLATDAEKKFCFTGGNALTMWPIAPDARRECPPPARCCCCCRAGRVLTACARDRSHRAGRV